MKVRVQAYPGLGNVTTATAKRQPVTVVLELPQYFVNEKWQVSLWYSVDSTLWQSLNLVSLAADKAPVDLAKSSPLSKLYFRGHIDVKCRARFTVKFRHDMDQPWIWVKQEYGLEDGIIVAANAAIASERLEDLIPNLSSQWVASTRRSQSPGTSLWALTSKIAPSQDDKSSFKDVEIGTPFGQFRAWFALVRSGIPWIAPRKGKSLFSLDKEAMICSFANDQGRHLVLLAVSGVDDVSCLFRGTDSNSVLVHARNDSTVERDITVLVSEGSNVERAIAAVVYHARTLIWKYAQASSSQAEVNNPGDFKPKWRENWYDGLGYCTWNSLGQNLSQDKIMYALDKLHENSINISNLIIDDNWQSIDVSDGTSAQPGWLEFEANSYGFPDGLKGAVSKIKSKHRNIQHVFVWHALLGYWGGISPRGKIAQKYETVQVQREDDGSNMTIVAHDDISKIYDDFYSFLIRSGVDGVKTDAQCMLDTIANAPARKELTNAYLDKWSIASLRHFGSNAISCMSQFPQALFHAFMPQTRPPLVVRNSDDYFPDVPSSHRWHVWANAHNNIFSQYLNVVPDWDMFQTAHDFADFHAAARCLSGGPIYITDAPGEHCIELLRQFTAGTTLGKTVVLRPSVVGIAMDPYLNYDSGPLLKIGSYHGSATGGVSILGVFQTSEAESECLIPLSEFRGVEEPGTYVVRAYTIGRVSHRLELTGDLVPLVLATPSAKGYEIYSAYRLQSFESQQCGDISVATLGLIDKMTGCAAIESSSYLVGISKISVVTKLKALGSLGIYISSLPHMNIDDNFMVTIFGHPVPRHTVQVSATAEAVLEVDVAAAWRELELDSGWSNELEVTVNVLGL